MARAYQVTSPGNGKRFGATQADSRAKRDELVEKFGVKKSTIEIEEVEIPVGKADLLEFINTLAAEADKEEE
jgi:hypothetical protein